MAVGEMSVAGRDRPRLRRLPRNGHLGQRVSLPRDEQYSAGTSGVQSDYGNSFRIRSAWLEAAALSISDNDPQAAFSCAKSSALILGSPDFTTTRVQAHARTRWRFTSPSQPVNRQVAIFRLPTSWLFQCGSIAQLKSLRHLSRVAMQALVSFATPHMGSVRNSRYVFHSLPAVALSAAGAEVAMTQNMIARIAFNTPSIFRLAAINVEAPQARVKPSGRPVTGTGPGKRAYGLQTAFNFHGVA